MEQQQTMHAALKRTHRRRYVGIACAFVAFVLAALTIVGVLFWQSVLVPGWAAAKYDLVSYVAEDDVTAYIETYRTMWAMQVPMTIGQSTLPSRT